MGWVSVARREDCLKGRTAGDVPEMLNEISSSSLSLRSRVLYTRTLGEMHPRVCVPMCVRVCVWGVSFWIPILRLFIMSSSFSPYSFVLCVCVFFFFVFAKDWRPVHWVHYAPADIDNPFTHTHTHSASRRFRIYRLISSDQLANGISP